LAVTSAHLARAICRRAERRVIRLDRQRDDSAPAISPHLIVYLNRLSDLLFVLARAIGQAAGDPETAWQRPRTET
jgi:cob(I)alamin adenosyltransferase